MGLTEKCLTILVKASANSCFKARSANRDAETDYSRVEPVVRSIGKALKAAEAAHSGLDKRMQDVLARASISQGNGCDEYLDRNPADTHHLTRLIRQRAPERAGERGVKR
jgi:hypothetical protein